MSQYLDSNKILDHFQRQLSVIRTGLVNASVLDHITVVAYGSKMKIVEIAAITKPEPSQLMITPFDKGLISGIAKAIRESNLGINPADDGAGIRLVFPPLTEENRKNRIKEVTIELENTKIVVRNERQSILKQFKQQKEQSEISEDELKKAETEVQKEVEILNAKLEEISKNKEAELMKM